MLAIVRTELISRYHDKLPADKFGIEKTQELITRKYYWLTLRLNVKTYVTGCDVYLTLKAVKHKLYGDLQLLPVSTKDLSIDFITRLSVSTNWKGDTYNLIVVIVDWLMKMVYYEPVKITIDAASLAEVILNVVVQ